jgi:micrococcal nuclease
MDRTTRTLIAALAALAVGGTTAACADKTSSAAPTRPGTQHVRYVPDGDTIDLTSGAKVRLVQIDAPEIDTNACYAKEAQQTLRRLAPKGVELRLDADPRLDRTDRFGRELRYAYAGATNLNLELVREGAAMVYFFRGDKGRFASELVRAGRDAQAQHRGLWGACDAVWDPYHRAKTSYKR